jgi:hypothetical protein
MISSSQVDGGNEIGKSWFPSESIREPQLDLTLAISLICQ